MSIQTELTRLTNAKAAIKTAIEGKGVTVPSGTLLDGMAALIESIEAGGSKITYCETAIPNANRALYFPCEFMPNVLVCIGALSSNNASCVGLVFHVEKNDGTIYQEKRRYQSTKYIIGTSVTDGSLFTLSLYNGLCNITITENESSHGTIFNTATYKVIAAHI